MTTSMQGQMALVTGAGPGIGRACAQSFARAGADVVVAARNAERLAQMAEELQEAHPDSTITPMTFDLADVESCRLLVERVAETCGGVDHLVNVATMAGGGLIDTDDFEHWRRAFEANVIGTLELSRSAARRMAERGGGAIVQISTFGTLSLPKRLGSYTATKQAMVSASMTLAKEVGRDNVRVNVVVPGYVTGPDLDMLIQGSAARSGEDLEVVSKRLAATASLRQHVDPWDIAEAALFLCSPSARHITGVSLPVTAGQ